MNELLISIPLKNKKKCRFPLRRDKSFLRNRDDYYLSRGMIIDYPAGWLSRRDDYFYPFLLSGKNYALKMGSQSLWSTYILKIKCSRSLLHWASLLKLWYRGWRIFQKTWDKIWPRSCHVLSREFNEGNFVPWHFLVCDQVPCDPLPHSLRLGRMMRGGSHLSARVGYVMAAQEIASLIRLAAQWTTATPCQP